MAKVKIDVQQIKQVLMARGERIGLGAAVAVMAIFLLLGVLSALRSSSPERQITQANKELQSRISPQGGDNEIALLKRPTAPQWTGLQDPEEVGRITDWIREEGASDTKRRNPVVLPIGNVAKAAKAEVGGVQVDTKRDPVFLYDVNPETGKVVVFTEGAPVREDETDLTAGPAGPGVMMRPAITPNPGGTAGAGGGAEEPVYKIRAARLVVVQSVFPYRDQMEVFRKALRKESVNELFGPREYLAPKIVGLNVVRYEVTGPDSKSWPTLLLYTADARGRAVVGDKATETATLLKLGVYDKKSAAQMLKATVEMDGLATPLIKLAHGKYDDVKLPGINLKEEKVAAAEGPMKGPGPPGMRGGPPGVMPLGTPGAPGAGADQASKTDKVEYSKLASEQLQDLFARRLGVKRLYIFYPFGLPASQFQGAVVGGPAGLVTGKLPKMPTQPGTAMAKDDAEDDDAGPAAPPPKGKEGPDEAPDTLPGVPEKCLVRFFDADVQPGKTYVYAMQVRMLNPNYKKPDVVAYKQLADIRELPNPNWTYTPPVTLPPEWDYYVVDERVLRANDKSWRVARGSDAKLADKDQVAIQIARWFEKFEDQNFTTRDLGDWVVLERALFRRGEPIARKNVGVEVPEWNPTKDSFQVANLRLAKSKKEEEKLRGLDFTPPAGAPPVVVDFTGGTRIDIPVGRSSVYDDAAVDLLVLAPDGKLRLHSGREDSAADTPRGKERMRHYNAWHERLVQLFQRSAGGGRPTGPPGTGRPPGVPPGGRPPGL